MIRKITAVIAAAACAGVLVTFVPGLAPEVAAGASPPVDQSKAAPINKPAEAAAANAADVRNAMEQDVRDGSRNPANACVESWPYYERSCLRGGHHTDGAPRVVRVIAMDRSAVKRPRR